MRGGSAIDDWDDLLGPFGSSGGSDRVTGDGWSNSSRGGGSFVAEDVDRTYSWAAKIGELEINCKRHARKECSCRSWQYEDDAAIRL